MRTGTVNGFVEGHGLAGCGKTPSPAWSWEGHGFSRAVSGAKETGFSPWGKYRKGQKGNVETCPTKALTFRTVLLIAVGMAVLGAINCKRESPTNAGPFPASNEVAGWVKTGETRTFTAADLWKYIDGDAERYLKAAVQSVSTNDYKFQNKVDAVVDIYTMGNAEGAEKIFSTEPAGDGKPIQLGDGARLHSQSLVFRKGAFLVRIVAYEESVETPQALLLLGQGIELRLAR